MPVQYSDRFDRAPVEGEFYDPKGYSFLKQFRLWAKIVTAVSSLMLFVAMLRAVIEEQPGPFFVTFFVFVIILGVIGIAYDKSLEAHKSKVSKQKERERRILTKSIIISKKRLENASHQENVGT